MRQNADLFHYMEALNMKDRTYQRPSRRLALAEGPRALSEIASLMAAAPFLATAPRGDGHAVLVMPGFGAGDRSTRVIRGFLKSLGYKAQPWQLGTNLGPVMSDLPASLAERLDEVFTSNGQRKISLVGWSLGGVYARLLAQKYPDKVRQVITLGSPFGGRPRSGEPLHNVPSTAIFSKTDGVVPWLIASQQPTDIAENIEVYSSHLGLGFNSAVLYALADRLSNPADQWRPFNRIGWKRFVYGPAKLESDTASADASSVKI